MRNSISTPGSAHHARRRERLDRSLIAVGVACLVFSHRSLFSGSAGRPASASALDQALFDPSMTAPILALAAFALLVFHRRDRVEAAYRSGSGSALGAAVLGLGIVTLLWSREISADRLSMPSLILHVVGAAIMIGGGRLMRALALPLAALALAVPLPPQVMHELVFALQLWTVSLSSFLLDLLGRVHEVQGDLILYDGARFQVIEGCSGFKSTVSLVLAAIVYADFVVRGLRTKWVLVALAVPIGILMNGVRVVILILGRIPPESTEHAVYGILAVVVGVLVLSLVEIVIARIRIRRIDAATRGRRPPGELTSEPALSSRRIPSSGRLLRLAFVGVVLSTLLASTGPWTKWPSPSTAINIESLPESIDGRAARSLKVDDVWLGSVWFGHRIYRSYDPDPPRTGSIRVFIGHEDVSSAERSGYSPKSFIPASGWRSIEPSPSLEGGPRSEEYGVWHRWVIEYPDRSVLVQQWRPGFAPWGWETTARWLGLDRAGALGKRRSPLVIRLEMDADVGGETRAWMILRQFATRIEAWRTRAGT